MGLLDEESTAAATAVEIRKQRGITKGKVTWKMCIRDSIERGDLPEMLKGMHSEVKYSSEQLEMYNNTYMKSSVDEKEMLEAESYIVIVKSVES